MLATDVMTEKELQESIIAAARDLGWLVFHAHNSRRSEPGFPDLVMVRPPRVIFAELKTNSGKLTLGKWNKAKTRYLPGQWDWMDALLDCPGVTYWIWKPRDLDKIIEILRGQNQPSPAKT